MLLPSLAGGPSPQPQAHKPAKPENAEDRQTSAPAAEKDAADKPQQKQTSAAPQEASPAQSAQAPRKAEAVQPAPAADAVETARKPSAADEEAFARAAAQRGVDSARTRALLATIDPVNNSAVQAAKSYVSQAPQDGTAEKTSNLAPAPKPDLDKAA